MLCLLGSPKGSIRFYESSLGLGFRVRVQGLGFRVQGLGFSLGPFQEAYRSAYALHPQALKDPAEKTWQFSTWTQKSRVDTLRTHMLRLLGPKTILSYGFWAKLSLGFWYVQGLPVNRKPTWQAIWVVVNVMVPFWVPIFIRHLLFRVPKKGP